MQTRLAAALLQPFTAAAAAVPPQHTVRVALHKHTSAQLLQHAAMQPLQHITTLPLHSAGTPQHCLSLLLP